MSETKTLHATPRSWVMLICLAVIWGASFMGGKIALTGFAPLTVAALRISIGAAVLTAMAYLLSTGLPPLRQGRGPRIWLHALGMAVFTNAVPFSLLAWGQLRVTSGFAGITMAVVPLLVLPLAHVFVPGERMGRWKVAGFGIGFVGVVILVGGGALGSAGDPLEPLARVACVAAASCYAIGGIVTRLCPPTPTLGFSAAGLLIAAALIVPVALIVDGLPGPVGAPALWAVLYLGLFPTALATLVLVNIINTAGPSFLSLVNYQVPVFAVVFGVVLLGEPLPGQFLGALGLVLLGLLLSQIRRPAPQPRIGVR